MTEDVEKSLKSSLNRIQIQRDKVDKMPTGYIKDKAKLEICGLENTLMDWMLKEILK